MDVVRRQPPAHHRPRPASQLPGDCGHACCATAVLGLLARGTASHRRENYLQTQHSTRPALELPPVEATSLETQPASLRCALRSIDPSEIGGGGEWVRAATRRAARRGGSPVEINCTAGRWVVSQSWRWRRRTCSIRWSTDETGTLPRLASKRVRDLPKLCTRGPASLASVCAISRSYVRGAASKRVRGRPELRVPARVFHGSKAPAPPVCGRPELCTRRNRKEGGRTSTHICVLAPARAINLRCLIASLPC